MRRGGQPTVEKILIRIEETVSVPCRIITERRRSIRSSIGKKEAVLRLPLGLSPTVRRARKEWFIEWLRKQFAVNPHLGERFRQKDYRTGDRIEVGGRIYHLRILRENRKSHSGKLKEGGTIELKLSQSAKEEEIAAVIGKLLSRVIGADFLPEIEARVHELNQRHFRQPVKGVRLKYNHSNWGSCSTKGYINLSTRLLFAPPPVIDYVIIHELAHLIEFNHSPRFWRIVREIVPDYREKQQWLKEHGGKCYF